jgi:Flp pilus assembly protein TadD
MDDHFSFGFSKNPPFTGVPFNCEEAEPILRARLNDPNEDHPRVRLDLLRLYRSMGRAADALAVATDYLAGTLDVEASAEAFFHLGQAMENIQDWESAIRWYTQAMELRPRSTFYWYMIHNNIGYSLNQQGRFVDAEVYMRKAISIDPHRANAFKNLGLSLEGQGRLAHAARSYVGSIRADAADPRALRHLEELVERHSEVMDEIPDIENQIVQCREAVEYVARNGGWSGSGIDRVKL